MQDNEAVESPLAISSMEMLAMGGFALFFAWMYLCFFWLFCVFPSEVSTANRDLVQLFVFLAMPLGFIVMHVRGKNPEFNIFAMPIKVTATVLAVIQPFVALAMHLGAQVPLAVVGVANFLALREDVWVSSR